MNIVLLIKIFINIQNRSNAYSLFLFFTDVDVEKASLENVPANLYESVCVPDLGDFLGYQSATSSVATPEHKSPATPASSTTSNSSGPQNASQTISPAAPIIPLPPRQFHNEGKSFE